ncbi:hypothetical protein [Nocardioides plantarum]|uniref:Uncharacterized protein n=1 Tax=Nocardioides plantarum TaxID=29299 RepID=A0ABV5KHC4_9ACTN|nr:hypothetical protein [Nocardioides plantarum]
MTDDLVAEDYDSVDEAMRAVGCTSLNQLFDIWQDLVRQVEEGYAWTEYEYWDELSSRDAIARAWPILTPRIRRLREPALLAIDTRFRLATVPNGADADATPGWWRRRWPRLTDDFQ